MYLAASEAVEDETHTFPNWLYVLFRASVYNMYLCATPHYGQVCWNIPHAYQPQSAEQTAGKRDRLKPGVIQEASHLKKSADSGFHNWVITLIPYRWRRMSWAVRPLNMVLLCLVASTFDTEWVQPEPLRGIRFQLILGVIERPVWSFLASLQQVLKLD